MENLKKIKGIKGYEINFWYFLRGMSFDTEEAIEFLKLLKNSEFFLKFVNENLDMFSFKIVLEKDLTRELISKLYDLEDKYKNNKNIDFTFHSDEIIVSFEYIDKEELEQIINELLTIISLED
jgi:signal transduction histidine kinase